MEFLLRDGFISFVFLLVGGGLYFILSHLIDSIGKEGIDRVYETKKERQTRERIKRKIGRWYAILLFLLVIVINIFFYYLRMEGLR